MSKIDLVLVDLGEAEDDTGIGMTATKHKAESQLSKLEEAWPRIIAKLRDIVEKEGNATTAGGFYADTIEFAVGIEGGVRFGLSATANASATVTFKRDRPGA